MFNKKNRGLLGFEYPYWTCHSPLLLILAGVLVGITIVTRLEGSYSSTFCLPRYSTNKLLIVIEDGGVGPHGRPAYFGRKGFAISLRSELDSEDPFRIAVSASGERIGVRFRAH